MVSCEPCAHLRAIHTRLYFKRRSGAVEAPYGAVDACNNMCTLVARQALQRRSSAVAALESLGQYVIAVAIHTTSFISSARLFFRRRSGAVDDCCKLCTPVHAEPAAPLRRLKIGASAAPKLYNTLLQWPFTLGRRFKRLKKHKSVSSSA